MKQNSDVTPVTICGSMSNIQKMKNTAWLLEQRGIQALLQPTQK